jgi:hypothetical protein
LVFNHGNRLQYSELHNASSYYLYRRAKAEEESRKKALRERAKKGLLTEQEKKILAEAEAKGSGDDKDKCVIM